MPEPVFYQRDEASLAEEHRRDQRARSDEEGGRVPYLFLSNGVTSVRILPPYSAAGKFCLEIKEHSATRDGRYSPVPCGRHYGIDCAFCNEGERLYEVGSEDSIEAAKELRPKSSFLFNVLVNSTPDGKGNLSQNVKVMKSGVGVKRDILDLDQDAAGGWADITNLSNGVDLRITRRGQGRFNTKYSVKPVPNRTGLVDLLAPAGLTVNDLTLWNLDEVTEKPTAEGLASSFAESNTTPGFEPNPVQPVPVEAPLQIPVTSPGTVVTPHQPQATGILSNHQPGPGTPIQVPIQGGLNIPAPPPAPPTKEGE